MTTKTTDKTATGRATNAMIVALADLRNNKKEGYAVSVMRFSLTDEGKGLTGDMYTGFELARDPKKKALTPAENDIVTGLAAPQLFIDVQAEFKKAKTKLTKTSITDNGGTDSFNKADIDWKAAHEKAMKGVTLDAKTSAKAIVNRAIGKANMVAPKAYLAAKMIASLATMKADLKKMKALNANVSSFIETVDNMTNEISTEFDVKLEG